MSANETKRGLVRTQQTTVRSPVTSDAWEAVKAAVLDAEQRHAAMVRAEERGDAPEAELDLASKSFVTAYDLLISTPAPNGEALAFKINYVLQYAGFAEVATTDARSWIANNGRSEDKAGLAIYLDAMALSGVQASVHPLPIVREWDALLAAFKRADAANEDSDDAAQFINARRELLEAPAPDWSAVAVKVEVFANLVGLFDVNDPAEMASARTARDHVTRYTLTLHRLASAPEVDERAAAVAVELLARECVAAVYPGFAVNPEGLYEAVLAITSLQRDVADLIDDLIIHHEALKVRFGDRAANDQLPEAPRLRLVWDAARDTYETAKAAYDPDGPVAEAISEAQADALHDAYVDALDAFFELAPPDLLALSYALGEQLQFRVFTRQGESVANPEDRAKYLDQGDAAERIALQTWVHLETMRKRTD